MPLHYAHEWIEEVGMGVARRDGASLQERAMSAIARMG